MIRIDISNYVYILLMILAFGCGTVMGQTFIKNYFYSDQREEPNDVLRLCIINVTSIWLWYCYGSRIY